MYINELYHHGIKGQRWGIRRFQNEDGSLTSAGRKHYDVDESRGSYSTSKRIRKLQSKYEAKGMSPEQAQKAAIRRRNVERVVAVSAAVTVAAVAAYAVHKNGQRAKTVASDILRKPVLPSASPAPRLNPPSKKSLPAPTPIPRLSAPTPIPKTAAPKPNIISDVAKAPTTASNVTKTAAQKTASVASSAPKRSSSASSNIKLGFDTVGSFNNQELLRSLNDLKSMGAAQSATMRGQAAVFDSLDELTRSFLH